MRYTPVNLTQPRRLSRDRAVGGPIAEIHPDAAHAARIERFQLRIRHRICIDRRNGARTIEPDRCRCVSQMGSTGSMYP